MQLVNKSYGEIIMYHCFFPILTFFHIYFLQGEKTSDLFHNLLISYTFGSSIAFQIKYNVFSILEMPRCYLGILGGTSLTSCLCQQIRTELGCSLIPNPITDFLNSHQTHLVLVPPYTKLKQLGVFV